MNGAQALIRTLYDGGVDTCFMNPGTSEMHFVAALDSVPEMHSVLCLFEGVATGCADGYARMTGKPAATLLHLGPGLGNGISNLHNGRKAHSPIVNIVGDHATYHLQYDAPLTSDIEGLARPVSGWVRTSPDSRAVAEDGAEAIAAACTPPGQVATLILPADTAWGAADGPAPPRSAPPRAVVPEARISAIARLLRRGEETVLLVGDQVMCSAGISELACRIAAGANARVVGNRAAARVARGAGRPVLARLPYPVDQAVSLLAGARHVVLAGAKDPVGFFAYPDSPSRLAPPDAGIHLLASEDEDVPAALDALNEELGAPATPTAAARLERPALPTGELTPEAAWTALCALMPENAIVADESVTCGRQAYPHTETAPPHDWLHVTGGSIGQGLPAATGAAAACPDRQVFAMEGDGSGMYTLQALWTQARESLNVVNVIFANRSYRILQGELLNVGGDAEPGPHAQAMMRLDSPELNWVSISEGMGVPAIRVETADAFVRALGRGIEEPGPMLIEAMI
ncbi:MAG: acetolactate synthase large subunit [Caldilineaceae bacterium SB0661_bin_32]|uniref:Acetolactate synthase large subunit n=1 Tax=Caldilineaceae bacterium SB0661_bin_32 TaxID=2605255 RepID=A0A6B1D3G6_9CHLR|nr:acetolactate synthase large subunit [Caldilineaceae bacterium SB0661_bin_32]